MARPTAQDDAAFNKHYGCVSYSLNYNLNCSKLYSPHDSWNSDNGQHTMHLYLISGSIFICIGLAFMAILCWSFCITKGSSNTRGAPRAAPRYGRRPVAVVQGIRLNRQ